MKNIFVIIIISALTVLSATSCNDQEPKSELRKKTEKMGEATRDLGNEVGKTAKKTGENIKDAAEVTQQNAVETREALRKDIAQTVDNINEKIDKTDKKMQKAAKDQKIAWEKDKKNLIIFRERLKVRSRDIGDNMKIGWNEFVDDVNQTLKEVKDKLNQ